MAKAYFMVRAEVSDPTDRAPFDHWYKSDHLPLAVEAFKANRGWRCWSRIDPAVHIAFYEFDSVERAQAILASDAIKALIADFDKNWGNRVKRTRDILETMDAVPA